MMKILPVVTPVKTNELVNKDLSDQKDSFRDIFDKSLQNLNVSQLNAEDTSTNFLTGEVKDFHTVIIALEEAKLTMQLAVEVRNKLIESYQEISRMQV